MRRTRLVVSVSSILLLVSVAKVDAATYTWANTGTDWGNGANWGGTPPGGSDVGQFTLPSYNFQPNVAELDTIGGVWNTGAGAVTVTGSSILTINGTTIGSNVNTGIELDPSAGALSIGAQIALGGSQQWLNNSGSALTTTGPLYLGINSLTFAGSGQTSVSSPITGQGNLIVASGANVVFSTTSAATVNSYVGTTQINGGLLTLQAPGASATILPPTTAVSVTSGGTLNLNGISSNIGSLAGDITSFVQLGAGTLSTGAMNAVTVFAGQISGLGGLTKTGAGTQTLSGNNTYSGATTISAGVLQIDGGSAASREQHSILSSLRHA